MVCWRQVLSPRKADFSQMTDFGVVSKVAAQINLRPRKRLG